VTSRGVLTDSYTAEAFGVVLEGARTRSNLTRDEIALRASVSSKHVGMLERGDREPELSTFIDLAVAMGPSPTWLLEELFAWWASNDPPVDAAWAHARSPPRIPSCNSLSGVPRRGALAMENLRPATPPTLGRDRLLSPSRARSGRRPHSPVGGQRPG
jgi:DNA-binding XRE family transcriptional regulator